MISLIIWYNHFWGRETTGTCTCRSNSANWVYETIWIIGNSCILERTNVYIHWQNTIAITVFATIINCFFSLCIELQTVAILFFTCRFMLISHLQISSVTTLHWVGMCLRVHNNYCLFVLCYIADRWSESGTCRDTIRLWGNNIINRRISSVTTQCCVGVYLHVRVHNIVYLFYVIADGWSESDTCRDTIRLWGNILCFK